MTSQEAILKIMQEQGKTNADLASILGITQAALWDRLKSTKKSSLTVKKLNETLRPLGYEVVIMPRAKAGKIDNAYVVNDEVQK